ncbi:hypothetical protein Tco_1253460 [Tanacetum coccineum]
MGGNLLTKTPRDALKIIENKSKVRNLRNKPVVSKVSANTSSSTTACPSEMAALTDAVNAMLRHVKTSPSKTIKAISESCVTCGGPCDNRDLSSFDVIVGMDWVSKRKFVIVCYEKVVRIPLEGDGILRVHGELTQGVVKTLMNTKSKEEHEVHLKLVLESLRKENLYTMFSKCEFWLEEMHFLGHVVNHNVMLVGPSNATESVRDAIRFEYCIASSSGWTNIRCAPFEALYGRKCRSPILWAEIGESSLTGLELVQETTDNVVLIKEKLKAVRDRQKSYADKRRKPLEFEVGDRVLLMVSPWKGVIIVLWLPRGLRVCIIPFMCSLKKCLVDANLHVPLDVIKVDKTLTRTRGIYPGISTTSDTSIDFQIDFSISIGERVTHWFTLTVLSALRRSGNENMLSLNESNANVLERFYTLAGNPVKEILLKLNLPDHRSILTDLKEQIKMEMEVPGSS